MIKHIKTSTTIITAKISPIANFLGRTKTFGLFFISPIIGVWVESWILFELTILVLLNDFLKCVQDKNSKKSANSQGFAFTVKSCEIDIAKYDQNYYRYSQ